MKYRATFFLKEPTAAKETPINAHFYFAGKRFKMATGMMVHPKHWDANRQRARKGTAYQTIINDRLDEMELQIASIYEQLRREHVPITPQSLRERYLLLHCIPEDAPPSITFFDRYEQFIADVGSRLQRGTVLEHKTARSHLRTFAEKKGIEMDYDSLDAAFFKRLVAYLVGEIKVNNTTAWKIVRTIFVFLKYSIEQGHTDNVDYKKIVRRDVEKGEKSLAVYLTPQELQSIIDLDLSSDPRLERARDVFMFQAHTGMRYGDVRRIRPEHIHGETIQVVTHKNRKSIRIPFLPYARSIWEKYKGSLPAISNQKQNEYIKELVGKAGITGSVVKVDYRGNERIEEVLPKSELISTHTAKRTFVTILRQRGVSVEAIMRATGNSRRTIETYIVTTEDDVHREITSAWHKPAVKGRTRSKRAAKRMG